MNGSNGMRALVDRLLAVRACFGEDEIAAALADAPERDPARGLDRHIVQAASSGLVALVTSPADRIPETVARLPAEARAPLIRETDRILASWRATLH